jgi:glycosyltransferase involved in cell wall biosynthesis
VLLHIAAIAMWDAENGVRDLKTHENHHRMKNILFISSYIGLGGGETATLSLVDHLPTTITPHLMVPAEGTFAAAWRERGWPVTVLPYRGASTYFVPAIWARLPIRREIERAIRENAIDLVHSDYHTLPMALPAAEAAEIPLVWTVMGWWFRPKPWQRGFFQRPAATFAHSQAIKRGFLGEPPFMDTDRIQVLYPGVDTSRFSPRVDRTALRQELCLGDDTPLVVMVGRFQHVKGHETFIRMAWIVGRRLPDAHFVIAGENTQSERDNSYRDRVLALPEQERRVTHRIHFIGHRPDVERVLAAADVVVCPSDFESFGVVNVEAMASGRPVVSTNNGGPAEVVVDGVTGYLVPPKDPQAIADRVIELLYSENTRRSFGAAGRLRVQQMFSAEAAAETFLAGLPT